MLSDPGEGTQRQLTLAGVSACSITRICLTHLHGDHYLGLPGVLQRMALDGSTQVALYYPGSGQEYVDRLVHATPGERRIRVRQHPVSADGIVDAWAALTLSTRLLDHRIDAYGWRLDEPDGVRMLPRRLEEHGIRGPDIGRLQREGRLGSVRLEDVSQVRPGQSFSFVMDTRRCAAAVDLARGVDLLVTEPTYLSSEAALAEQYAHLTATDAAQIALEAGARMLVLTHYSQRHSDESVFEAEAREHFPRVSAGRDLDRIPLPRRRRPGQSAESSVTRARSATTSSSRPVRRNIAN